MQEKKRNGQPLIGNELLSDGGPDYQRYWGWLQPRDWPRTHFKLCFPKPSMEPVWVWFKKLGLGRTSMSLCSWFKTYSPEKWTVGMVINNIASDYHLEGDWRHFSSQWMLVERDLEGRIKVTSLNLEQAEPGFWNWIMLQLCIPESSCQGSSLLFPPAPNYPKD